MTAKVFIDQVVKISNDDSKEIEDIRNLVREYLFCKEKSPYIEEVTTIKRYNPKYGDDKKCKCGHTYSRHFDLYDDDELFGCKYCGCYDFILDE